MAIIALVFSSGISLFAGILSYLIGFGVLASLLVWLCSGSALMIIMLQRYMAQGRSDPRHFGEEIEADMLALKAYNLPDGGAASHN